MTRSPILRECALKRAIVVQEREREADRGKTSRKGRKKLDLARNLFVGNAIYTGITGSKHVGQNVHWILRTARCGGKVKQVRRSHD